MRYFSQRINFISFCIYDSMMRIKKFSIASSHNFSMVGTALVVATALLLGTVVMMIGVDQKAEAASKKLQSAKKESLQM
jgi:hypothetical protein